MAEEIRNPYIDAIMAIWPAFLLLTAVEHHVQRKNVDDCLPVTGSRNAKWWYAAPHNVTAMVGAGVLRLPNTMVHLYQIPSNFFRGPGTVVFVISWLITLYTLGKWLKCMKWYQAKIDLYHELGQQALGENLEYGL